MDKKNILIFYVESLRYDRLFGTHIPPKYKMSELNDFINDSTVFHKCINASNSSFMSTANILMGNEMCYHHNTNYFWYAPLDSCTVVNDYGDPLFSILEKNGFIPGAFFSPKSGHDHDGEFVNIVYYHALDGVGGKKVGTIWGCSLNKIHWAENKKQNADQLIDFISENKNKNFAAFHCAWEDHFASTPGGPEARLKCFKETSNQLGRIINHLKKLGVYHKTDIYLYGDHGDSHYAFSEASHDITLQHATTPFHTTTHVPLIVKSNYLNKEERYDLVSHMDVYSTVLNSLGIKQKKKKKVLKAFRSIDLSLKNRPYVVSQNKFVNQPANVGEGTFNEGERLLVGIAITKDEYVYVKNEKGVFLFNHIIDPLNVSNLLRGFKEITFDHQHRNHWFDENLMSDIKNKIIPEFEELIKNLSKKGYIRDDLNHIKPNL